MFGETKMNEIFTENWCYDDVTGEVDEVIENKDKTRAIQIMDEIDTLPTSQVKDEAFLDQQYNKLKEIFK